MTGSEVLSRAGVQQSGGVGSALWPSSWFPGAACAEGKHPTGALLPKPLASEAPHEGPVWRAEGRWVDSTQLPWISCHPNAQS